MCATCVSRETVIHVCTLPRDLHATLGPRRLQPPPSQPSPLMLLCSLLSLGALLLSPAPLRAPPASMLLGADGLPMKKGAAGAPSPPPPSSDGSVNVDIAAPTERKYVLAHIRLRRARVSHSPYPIPPPHRRNVFGSLSLPEDLADFDPTIDPLATEAPAHDLAAASGRPDEAVWGAIAAPTSDDL